MRIAVLLTTFNRRDKTIACLESLTKQAFPSEVEVELYVTDAASSDGTVEAVKKIIPAAHIYVDETLYWAGGMRNSWNEAKKSNPDYYLLLNDDTVLYETAIAVLLGKTFKPPALVIGSTVDPNTNTRSYGGRKLTSKNRWKDDVVVFSKTEYLQCDVANANIMLVPDEIVNKVGILCDVYTHGLADYDYTLKVNKAGFEVYVAPGFLGSCVNDHGHNWQSQNTSLKQRIEYLKSPKGLAYNEYMTFIKTHFPLSYPFAFFNVWMKTFFPFIWQTFKK
ncbi:MAG: glycosyltransferase family 2 protein [Segetibacter sp.]|nr:glycosyltransferase family 2 protein [Segetibacter sp.]